MEGRLNYEVWEQPMKNLLQRTMAVSAGTWAEGTNDSTIKTTGTITFMINGVMLSKGATDNIAPTVCASQAASKRCRYLITLDASGNATVTKGTQVRSYAYSSITTLSWEGKKLKDSANGLSAFQAGDKILISGFTYDNNNGIKTVDYSNSDGSYLAVRESDQTDEAAGDSITVTVESPLPEVPVCECPVGILRITTGTTAFIVGTDDITSDIGTGSAGFTDIGQMPAE